MSRGLAILLLTLMLSVTSWAKTIEVCADCESTTIKEAIEVAEDGDTILVHKGLYQEYELIIDKQVRIEGKDKPVIDGMNKGTIFKVEADNVKITGLELINVGQSYTKDFAAILVSNAENFEIYDNDLNKVFFGILVEKSKKGLVYKNRIKGEYINQASSGNGIHLWHCQDMEVYDNHVQGVRDGIYFEFVKNSTVYQNISTENLRYGLHFMFSNNNAYYENLFNKNGAGVAIMFSKFVKMYDNRFVNNWGSASYGLLLKEIYDAEIRNNIFDENTIGINIDSSTRIIYEQNTFSANGWAIKIIGACYENEFKQNNFLNNALDLSYNSKVNTNKFSRNYWSDYAGYDLDKDGIGDVPYRPVKLFSYIVHNTPETIVLLRSMFVDIINFSEKVSPVFTPDNLIDDQPLMKKVL